MAHNGHIIFVYILHGLYRHALHVKVLSIDCILPLSAINLYTYPVCREVQGKLHVLQIPMQCNHIISMYIIFDVRVSITAMNEINMHILYMQIMFMHYNYIFLRFYINHLYI